MTTQTNGTVIAAPIAVADPIQAALVQLIQMSSQTNGHLQKLAGELSTMNRQLFAGGEPTRAYQPAPAPTPAPVETAGPVATITTGDQPQPGWQKQIIKSRCSEIGITKVTTMTGKWKLNFYLDGEGWTPFATGWKKGEFRSLIRLIRHVMPEIGEDHFSESNFGARNGEHQAAGKDGNYEEVFTAPAPFEVEWYKKPAAANGRTYAYAERISQYPVAS